MGTEREPPLFEMVQRDHGRRFPSVRRGDDPAQVDDFLALIASRIETLEAELHQARSIPKVSPSPADEPADDHTKRIARLAEAGVREVEKMLAEEKAVAATILSDARSEADRITRDAKGVAGRSTDEARAFLDQVEEDARRILSEAAERRRQTTEEIRKMQERLLSISKDLDRVLNPDGGGL